MTNVAELIKQYEARFGRNTVPTFLVGTDDQIVGRLLEAAIAMHTPVDWDAYLNGGLPEEQEDET